MLYDAADAMDDDNYVIVLESVVIKSSLWIAQVNTKNISRLGHLVLSI